MKKRKIGRIFCAVLLWMIFLTSVAVIAYLSFQNGGNSAELGSEMIEKLAVWYYKTDNISSTDLYRFTYYVRQLGRAVLFFAIGILGTTAVHISSSRIPWLIKTVVAVVALVLIAWVTEKWKVYFPTRHYSETEMMISIWAALLGFSIVSLITLIYDLVYRISHKAAHD